jgi:hypothetical protein
LQKLEQQNVVIVAAAGNHARGPEGVPIQRYPPKFADPDDQFGGLPNMIVVAASEIKGRKWDDSIYAGFITTFAPRGGGINCPAAPGSASPMRDCGGTSFGTFTPKNCTPPHHL